MAYVAPTDIAGLFAKLGGTGASARALGVGQSTASEMKRRNSIPVKHWDRVIGLSDVDGYPITLETLHRLHRKVEVAA